MSDWADGGAEAPQENVEIESQSDVLATGDNAALRAQIDGLQNEMRAMQQYNTQFQSNMMGAMQQQNPSHPLAPPQPQPLTPGYDVEIDKDDPYYDQFKQVVNAHQSTLKESTELKQRLSQMEQQLNQVNMTQSRQNIQGQVDAALEKHRVPSSLSNDVKTTVYAYMASTPPGQQIQADHIVSQFMQNLGLYAENARKAWAEEAKKPKPLSVVASNAGISEDTPRDFDEAKERSLAMMQAMLSGG